MLPRISIDYEARGKPRWPGWALLAAMAVLGFDLGHTRLELERQLATWEVVSAPAKAKVPRHAGREPPDKAPSIDAQIEEASAVLAQLKTPWPALFRSIEEAHGAEVALLGLQPDAARRSVSIVGEVREYAEALAYVTRLRTDGKLANAHLIGNEVRENDPQRPVLFTVSAQWKAAK